MYEYETKLYIYIYLRDHRTFLYNINWIINTTNNDNKKYPLYIINMYSYLYILFFCKFI